MRKGVVGPMLSVAILGVSAAPVSAAEVDRASARTFLADATTYVHISVSRHTQLRTAARGFIEHLESSCPGSLAHAPAPIVETVAVGAPSLPKGSEGTPAQRATSRTFLTMALGEILVGGYAPIRAPALAFANELTHLRWTRPAIARTLADFSQSLRATLALNPPDFCVDARASAASGFAAAPGEATRFAEAFRAATLVNKGHSLNELAEEVRPSLAHRDLNTLVRFRRLSSRAKPLLQTSDATVLRLLRAVFHEPHS
jgi:hypothetical protein